MIKQTLSLSFVLAVGFVPASLLLQPTGGVAQDLPDAPAATAAALSVPNGPTAVLDTSMGRITCQFYEKQAPKTVENFIALAEGTKDWTDPKTGAKQHNKRYYDGTVFHRVIPDFMIQGGDPTGTGTGGPGYMFKDEFDKNLNFDRPGKLAMANSGPNTNGSQFFIVQGGGGSQLGPLYTIFGEVTAGQEVVDAIAAVKVGGPQGSSPATPVVINSVSIQES